jgi:hypothetical protein
MRPKHRGTIGIKKIQVTLKTVYFVYEVYMKATGCLNIIFIKKYRLRARAVVFICFWSLQNKFWIIDDSLSHRPLDLGRFLSFLILYTVNRTPWTGDQPVARSVPTNRIKARRHSCLEWDSNPWPQCSRGRRRFMPYTARPLWSTLMTSQEI